MKVFIIWSGPRSKEVAVALRNWLPDVMHACEPWISSEDIHAGVRWNPELAAQLEQSQFAVICLSPDNLEAPWIHFETGAISKKLSDKTRVAPYLFDVKTTDVVGPLEQFQAVNANLEGTLKLVRSINHAMDSNALANDRVDKYFIQYWPELETILNKIPPIAPEISKPPRDERDLLEEILELVRDRSRVKLWSFDDAKLRSLDDLPNLWDTYSRNIALPADDLSKRYEEKNEEKKRAKEFTKTHFFQAVRKKESQKPQK